MTVDFIGKHIPYLDSWPGSALVDGGRELSAVHLCHPAELVSDRSFHLYIMYGYARAYLGASSELCFWRDLYERMQRGKGRQPRVREFARLLDGIRDRGFDAGFAIPVDRNYDLMDGAHRLAACLALDQFPCVKVLEKMAKPYERTAFGFLSQDELGRVEGVRQELLGRRAALGGSALVTMWGMSIELWDDFLREIGLGRIRRAFQVNLTPQEYAAYIAVVYAGDGISDSSLLKKTWVLTKFTPTVGVLAVDIPATAVGAEKTRIRKQFVSRIAAYQYDSIMHTIDNQPYAQRVFDTIQPYKPCGDMPVRREVLPPLEAILAGKENKLGVYRPGGNPNARPVVNQEAVDEELGRRFGLVIFDLDGVLVDTEPFSIQAYMTLLGENGVCLTQDAATEMFAGKARPDAEALIKERYGVEFTPEQQARKSAFIREQRRNMRPIPGVKEFIGRLKTPMCIASGAGLDSIDISLKATGLDVHFPLDRRFSASMVSRGKPNPDLFLYAADQLGTVPQRCLVVEDSLPGLYAAILANMSPVWFAGTIRSQSYLGEILKNPKLKPCMTVEELEQHLNKLMTTHDHECK